MTQRNVLELSKTSFCLLFSSVTITKLHFSSFHIFFNPDGLTFLGKDLSFLLFCFYFFRFCSLFFILFSNLLFLRYSFIFVLYLYKFYLILFPDPTHCDSCCAFIYISFTASFLLLELVLFMLFHLFICLLCFTFTKI